MLIKRIQSFRSSRGSRKSVDHAIDSVDDFKARLAYERSRTDRSGMPFSVLSFCSDLDDPENVACDLLVEVLLGRVRETDAIGWMSAHRIGVLLPYTNASGAWSLADDVRAQLPCELPPPQIDVFVYPEEAAPADPSRPHEHADEHADGDDGSAPSPGPSMKSTHSLASSKESTGEKPSQIDFRGRTSVCDDLHQAAEAKGDRNASIGASRPVQPMIELLIQPMPWWKRAMDIVFAGTLFVLLSPLMLLIALAIKMSSPGPSLFRQWRRGIGGQPFQILKFRTMRVGAEHQQGALRSRSQQDGPAFKMKRDPRVTRIGRLLRVTSLDELPQLWNVIRGEMSLVGPRPLPIREADECEPWQRRRLEVIPGVTCIWQTQGRSRVSFETWMRMDQDYIRTRSLKRDIGLLFATVWAILTCRGAH